MPMNHHPQSVDLDLGSRCVLSRKSGRSGCLEQQLEFGVIPVPPFLLESERGERGVDFRGRRERQVHVLRRIAAGSIEFQRSATHEDGLDPRAPASCLARTPSATRRRRRGSGSWRRRWSADSGPERSIGGVYARLRPRRRDGRFRSRGATHGCPLGGASRADAELRRLRSATWSVFSAGKDTTPRASSSPSSAAIRLASMHARCSRTPALPAIFCRDARRAMC